MVRKKSFLGAKSPAEPGFLESQKTGFIRPSGLDLWEQSVSSCFGQRPDGRLGACG